MNVNLFKKKAVSTRMFPDLCRNEAGCCHFSHYT